MIVISTQNFAPDLGGMQAYLTGLADSLFAKGHDIAVYADTHRQKHPRGVQFDPPYRLNRFGGSAPLRRWLKAQAVWRLIKSGAVEALFADSWKSIEHLPDDVGFYTKVICLAHGAELLVRTNSHKAKRLSHALSKATLVAANSHYTASLVAKFVPDHSKIRTVWPGVAAPKESSNSSLSKAHCNNRLITIARLDSYKGIDRVLMALPSLRRTFPSITYDVVGQGRDLERLLSLQNELELNDCVVFHGLVSDTRKAELLRTADVFVLPNRDEPGEVEGFGIVFCEAAALSLPSVGGISGGVSDAIIDRETGLLVDGTSVVEVEVALRQLLSDPQRALALGSEGHRRFWSQMHWPVAIARFEALLQN